MLAHVPSLSSAARNGRPMKVLASHQRGCLEMASITEGSEVKDAAALVAGTSHMASKKAPPQTFRLNFGAIT